MVGEIVFAEVSEDLWGAWTLAGSKKELSGLGQVSEVQLQFPHLQNKNSYIHCDQKSAEKVKGDG